MGLNGAVLLTVRVVLCRIAMHALPLSYRHALAVSFSLFREEQPFPCVLEWLDLAEERFQTLDRLRPQRHAGDFLPLGRSPFLAKQETRRVPSSAHASAPCVRRRSSSASRSPSRPRWAARAKQTKET